MPTLKMHADEVASDVVLVRRLLGTQFPQWAGLPIVPCLLYTSDAADERSSVDLGGRRIIKTKKQRVTRTSTTSTMKKKYTKDTE